MNPGELHSTLQMCESIMASAAINFDRDGYLTMVAFLFGNTHDPHGNTLVRPGFQVVGMPSVKNNQEKDLVIIKLGELARKTRAAGVAVLAEAWTASVPTTEAHTIRPGHVQEMNDAREVVHLLLEHRDLPGPHHQQMWIAEIHRPLQRKAMLGKFELTPNVPVGGRLYRLLGTH